MLVSLQKLLQGGFPNPHPSCCTKTKFADGDRTESVGLQEIYTKQRRLRKTPPLANSSVCLKAEPLAPSEHVGKGVRKPKDRDLRSTVVFLSICNIFVPHRRHNHQDAHQLCPMHVRTYASPFLLDFNIHMLDLLPVKFNFFFELSHFFWVGTLDYCNLPSAQYIKTS